MAKAIYMGAHVGTMSGGALVISFAGEPHRVRAEEYRRDVEKALAAAAGRTSRCRWWSTRVQRTTTTTSCS